MGRDNGWRVYSSNTQGYYGYMIERLPDRVQVSLNRTEPGRITPVAYFPDEGEAEAFRQFLLALPKFYNAVPNRE